MPCGPDGKKKKKRIMRKLSISEISMVDRAAQQPATMRIMKRDENQDMKKEITESAVEDGTERVDKKEIDMPDTKTAAEIQKAADEKLAKVQAQLDTANKVNALGIVAKAHYDTLNDDGKSDFIAKSADEQTEIVKAAKQAAEDKDPVIYKAADGSEFRKSDDPRLVAMAKQGDVDRKENIALRKTNAEIVLRKRAQDELSNLPGSVESHMALLKSVDSITDETQRNEALAALKSQNTSVGKSFETVGETTVLKSAAGSPGAELEELSKAYADKHNVDTAKAMDEVLKTVKGAELYAKSVN